MIEWEWNGIFTYWYNGIEILSSCTIATSSFEPHLSSPIIAIWKCDVPTRSRNYRENRDVDPIVQGHIRENRFLYVEGINKGLKNPCCRAHAERYRDGDRGHDSPQEIPLSEYCNGSPRAPTPRQQIDQERNMRRNSRFNPPRRANRREANSGRNRSRTPHNSRGSTAHNQAPFDYGRRGQTPTQQTRQYLSRSRSPPRTRRGYSQPQNAPAPECRLPSADNHGNAESQRQRRANEPTHTSSGAHANSGPATGATFLGPQPPSERHHNEGTPPPKRCKTVEEALGDLEEAYADEELEKENLPDSPDLEEELPPRHPKHRLPVDMDHTR